MTRLLRRTTGPLALTVGLLLGAAATTHAPSSAPKPDRAVVTTPVREVAHVQARPLPVRAVGPVKNLAYRYGLPEAVVTNEFVVGFPKLPKGTYQASVSLLVQMTTETAPLVCYMDRPGTTPDTMYVYATAYSNLRTVNVTGVISTLSKRVQLHCIALSGSVATTKPASATPYRNYIDFVRIDGLKAMPSSGTLPRVG